jgi:hypothetical protein
MKHIHVKLTGLLMYALCFILFAGIAACNNDNSSGDNSRIMTAADSTSFPAPQADTVKSPEVLEMKRQTDSLMELTKLGPVSCSELTGTWNVIIDGEEKLINEQWEIRCLNNNKLYIRFSDFNLVFKSTYPSEGQISNSTAEFNFKDPLSDRDFNIQIGKRKGKIAGNAKIKRGTARDNTDYYFVELRKAED